MLPLRPNSPTSRLPLVGFTIIRVIVPLWIATGATMKLIAQDPGLLPRKTVFRWGIDLGIDLDVYLGSLIAIEYLLALTIVLVPLLSRTAAIAQLLAFVAVLFGEMLKGNFFDCGCLGGASPPPLVMLTIDCLLLLACIVLPLPRRGGPERVRRPVARSHSRGTRSRSSWCCSPRRASRCSRSRASVCSAVTPPRRRRPRPRRPPRPRPVAPPR